MFKYQVQLYILDQRVELFDSETIVMKSKIQDVRDVSKVFTDFSHEFTIPASKTNNRILRHILSPEATGLDPRAYHRAYIEINNNPFRQGFVLINAGEYRSGRLYSYKVRFMGGLVALSRALNDDFLTDLDGLRSKLDSELGFSSLAARNTAIRDFFETVPADTDDYTITLNAFEDGFFYDSRGTDDDSRRQDYRNIYFGNTENNNRSYNGVDLDRLRPSIRATRILEEIENQYRDSEGNRIIQFSRGFDANGLPTANPANVVQSDFLNGRRFTDLFMLLHSKIESEDLESRPSETLVFDRVWPQVLADNPASDGALIVGDSAISQGVINNPPNTTSRFDVYVDNDESGEVRSSRFYVDATITVTGGDWKLSLYNLTDNEEVWSTGATSGTYQSSNQGNDYVEIRDAGSGGRNQFDPQRLNSDGIGRGELLTFSTQGRKVLEFRLQRAEGATVTASDIRIKSSIRTRVRGFIFNDLEVNAKVTQNTVAIAPGTSSQDSFLIDYRIPKIKLLDLITGWWKMFNLVAYVEQDADGNDLIVTRELDRYYNDGRNYDLTEWVDSQEFKIEAPTFFNPIIFKYKDPSTLLAKEFFDENKDLRKYGYGSLSYDSEDAGFNFQLPYKEYKVELPFETIVLTGVVDENNVDLNTDIVYGWIVNESRSPTSPGPIFHYNEHVMPAGEFLGRDHLGMPVQVSNYNALTKSLIRDGNEVQSLTFGVENIERQTYAAGEGVQTQSTLFNNLYQNYIRRVFNQRARVYKFKGRLPAGIASDLTLADTVVISNNQYSINESEIDTSTGKVNLELISLNTAVADIPPEIIDFVAPLSVTVRQSPPNPVTLATVTFIASVTGGTGTNTFRWTVNNVVQPSTSNQLILTSFSEGDEVQVTVSSGTDSATHDPIIIQRGDNRLLRENGDFILTEDDCNILI